MSLVVLEDIGLSFGGRALFSGLNLRVGEEDRVGVIGRNGSGKSSLFKIISGQLEAESGSVRAAGGVRIGYLAQELTVPVSRSLREYVLASVPGKAEIENMLETVEVALSAAESEAEQMALSQKLVDLHEDLVGFDARYSPHEAARILSGLGFRESDMGRGLDEFSGGWRMRGVLAALLFQKPDLLLLDEPTNHLDVPSVAWLSDYLKRRCQAFALICHDREFLNEQAGRILSFEAEGVRQYSGNYDAYRKQRAEELEVLERRASNLAREKEAAERFIRRFRAQATKARAVQSRIRALEKMDEIVTPSRQSTLSFRFPPCKRAGQDVVVLRGVGHDYGAGPVFSDVDAVIRRGDRIALVGANGNGKTTLLKIAAGLLQPSSGETRLGYNVDVGYYAQHVTELLNMRSSIFDEVWRESALEDIGHVRGALGTMMFSGDDVDKAIGILSGGEKARVALARLMVNPGNLVVMDEPTNHLDLESAEALAVALGNFEGTLLFASHNRSFVNRLASRIWDVSSGSVREYDGTLSEYMDHCAGVEAAEESNPPQPKAPNQRSQACGGVADNGRRQRRSRSREQRDRRALQKKIAEYETRIAQLERLQSERSAELSLAETYKNQERYAELLAAYSEDADKLDELVGRWEHAQEELGDH